MAFRVKRPQQGSLLMNFVWSDFRLNILTPKEYASNLTISLAQQSAALMADLHCS